MSAVRADNDQQDVGASSNFVLVVVVMVNDLGHEIPPDLGVGVGTVMMECV